VEGRGSCGPGPQDPRPRPILYPKALRLYIQIMPNSIIQDLKHLDFNNEIPSVMHVDINSCFATIEQQYNPKLRGKEIAVCANNIPEGCILAPSIEAKRVGIKTGMRIFEAKKIFPNLITLEADPPKYRLIHSKMRKLLDTYTDHLEPKSIDEFVLHLKNYPAMKIGLIKVVKEIKSRIRSEIGEWISVSVGIGPNRFLAKTAAGLIKPDGLEQIDINNFLNIYSKLGLEDLHGISTHNKQRLNQVGIFSVLDFYYAAPIVIGAAFKSISSYYWILRLHGYEIDDFQTKRGSFSQSYVLPTPLTDPSKIKIVIQKLVEKCGQRLRAQGYTTNEIGIGIKFANHTYWHDTINSKRNLSDSIDIYKSVLSIYVKSPHKESVRKLEIYCLNIKKSTGTQLDLFCDTLREQNLTQVIDKINSKYGAFTIKPGAIIGTKEMAPDRIAFGR